MELPAEIVPACAARSRPFTYSRRQPEKTVFYAAVRDHLETMLAEARATSDSGSGLPFFVEREFRSYLDCGLLSRGFLRVRCDGCGDEMLVAFSCKNRTACPSCATRRMNDGAARLLDGVLPVLPWRQWVTSYPKWLRLHLALDGDLNSRVLKLSLAEIFKWQRRAARNLGFTKTRVAAVSMLQRFGSALQLNPHAHTMIPDGVFGPRFANAPDESPEFIRISPPTDEEVEAILHRIVRKVMRLAEVLGLRERPLSDEQLAIASTITLPVPRKDIDEPEPTHRRSAFFRGFSIHANVFCHENDREALGRLCRYALRPPFALERMSRTPSGDIAYKMKRSLPDGTETLRLTPTAFLRRVASLVPPPRRHLVRYFGVLAPHARDRAVLVPRPEAPSLPVTPPVLEKPPPRLRPCRIPWGELLRRVFAIDVFTCDVCSGRRRIISAITESAVAKKILEHVGLPAYVPVVLPARPPPSPQLGFFEQADPCIDAPAFVE